MFDEFDSNSASMQISTFNNNKWNECNRLKVKHEKFIPFKWTPRSSIISKFVWFLEVFGSHQSTQCNGQNQNQSLKDDLLI